MRADQVIIEPILSEKSSFARELECKKYTFKVDPRANKFEIMNAVKEIFKVNPTACNVMNMAGLAAPFHDEFSHQYTIDGYQNGHCHHTKQILYW